MFCLQPKVSRMVSLLLSLCQCLWTLSGTNETFSHFWSVNINLFCILDWKWRSYVWSYVTWCSSSQSDSFLQQISRCHPWTRVAGGYPLAPRHWPSSVSILVILYLQLFLETKYESYTIISMDIAHCMRYIWYRQWQKCWAWVVSNRASYLEDPTSDFGLETGYADCNF
jgi:hypothetical protein